MTTALWIEDVLVVGKLAPEEASAKLYEDSARATQAAAHSSYD